MSITVKNTGKYPGREVVQVYVSAPEGRLDQPCQALAAFAKTGVIEAGGSERVSLSFDMRDLASYDEDTASYILEAGDYIVLAGDSSADTKAAAVLERRGISAVIVKAPQHLRDRGCGYALSMTRRFPEAVAILQEQKLLTGRLYRKEDSGEYREVSEYDLFG